jgi:hypothetical protein
VRVSTTCVHSVALCHGLCRLDRRTCLLVAQARTHTERIQCGIIRTHASTRARARIHACTRADRVSATHPTRTLHVCCFAAAEYAQVTKMLGNGRLEALCFDGVKRLCHIRGKLRKKVRTTPLHIACGVRHWHGSPASLRVPLASQRQRQGVTRLWARRCVGLPLSCEIDEKLSAQRHWH